jgi:hypothetical protein
MRLDPLLRTFRGYAFLDRLRDWCWRQWAGTAWKTIALVGAFCVVNALRRNVNSTLLWEEPTEWLIDIADTTITGLLAAVPVVFAVVAAFGRIPGRGIWRAAAMIAVVALSTAVGAFGRTSGRCA